MTSTVTLPPSKLMLPIGATALVWLTISGVHLILLLRNFGTSCQMKLKQSATGACLPGSQRPLQPPRRRTNVHKVDPLDKVVAHLHDLQDLCRGSYSDYDLPEQNWGTTSVHEANFKKPTTDDSARDDNNPIQINTSKWKPLPPGNLKQLLSKSYEQSVWQQD